MSANPIQVFVASYDNESGAKQSLQDFQQMHRDGSIHLIDAAVIVRQADGKVKFEETADPSGKKWAKRGGGFKPSPGLEPGTASLPKEGLVCPPLRTTAIAVLHEFSGQIISAS